MAGTSRFYAATSTRSKRGRLCNMSVPPDMLDQPAQYQIGFYTDLAGTHIIKDNFGYDLGQSIDLELIIRMVNTANSNFLTSGRARTYRQLIGLFQ
jgi:hypothetical protein